MQYCVLGKLHEIMWFTVGNTMKNAAIYVVNDKNGQIKRYVLYCLQGIREVAGRVLVVVNGKLSPEGRDSLEGIGVEVLVRENTGFDWSGWKAGIEHFGYDTVAGLDNLILTNCTYYGPLYPFSEMFSIMEKRACDFWGINRHPESHVQWIAGDSSSRMLEHLQSYWLVFRNRVLYSREFKDYWHTLKPHKDYAEMVGYGETKLTRYFEDCGFTSDSYMDYKKYKQLLYDGNPTFIPDEQVIHDRCPVLKRKSFLYSGYIRHNLSAVGEENKIRETFDFLQKHSDYDTDLIWDDILESAHMSQLNDNLHFNYILSTTHCSGGDSLPESLEHKAALIVYIYPEDLVEYCHEYASFAPKGMDVFVVTSSPEAEEKAKTVFIQDNMNANVHFRSQINRGRDNSALLITCRDLIDTYDIVCFMHAKKSVHNILKINSDDFRNHCFKNLLFNEIYIKNILMTFYENKRLGLLVPFIPLTAAHHNLHAHPWTINYENSIEFLKKEYGITADLDPNLYPPFGGMFWFRCAAFKTLLSRDWKFEDFPKEPIPATDGLLTHVIERIYPMLAQRDGYYTAFVLPDQLAPYYLNTLYYRYREFMRECSILVGTTDFSSILQCLSDRKSSRNTEIHELPTITDYYETRIIMFYRDMKQKHPKLKNFIKKYFLKRK